MGRRGELTTRSAWRLRRGSQAPSGIAFRDDQVKGGVGKKNGSRVFPRASKKGGSNQPGEQKKGSGDGSESWGTKIKEGEVRLRGGGGSW